ncbi:MAG: PEGA domain-containing protein [bacterium]|nr:PEGA domain-containing protein [bacterium]
MITKRLILTLVLWLCLMSNGEAKNVAILEFEDFSSPLNPAGLQASQDLVRYTLSKEFKIIDQEVIKRVFDLSAFKKMGVITKDKAYSLGKLLDADILVVGNYQVLKKDSLLINTSFINTHYEDIPDGDKQILGCFEGVFSLEGRVKEISKKGIFIDIGAGAGLKLGDNFSLIRNNKPIGTLKIVKVDKESAEIFPTTEVKINVGDKVRKFLYAFEPKTTRHLIVSPTPPAQEIEIEGRVIGNSPLVVKNIQNKEITLRISKLGYKPELANISFYDYPMLNLSLMLFKSAQEEEVKHIVMGSVLVTSVPSSAYVYLGKTLKGMTPLLIPNLPTGVYRINIGKPGYETVEQSVIVEGVGQKKLDVKLKFVLPSLPPKEPPSELLTVQTPHLLKESEIDIGLKYPEGFILRLASPIENLEMRIAGLGIGVKHALSKNFALDFYYQTYDMRKGEKEKSSGVSVLMGSPVKLPSGPSEYYLGTGLLKKESHNELRYFGGVMSQLTRDLFLLLEYDKIDGYGLGIRFPLTPQLEFLTGIGKENGDFRYDMGIFFRGEGEKGGKGERERKPQRAGSR